MFFVYFEYLKKPMLIFISPSPEVIPSPVVFSKLIFDQNSSNDLFWSALKCANKVPISEFYES